MRAISMFSGGLDSQLSVCVIRAQGIDVEAVVFDSPFFDTTPAEKAAAALDLKLHIVDFSDELFALLKSPPHGFGSNMNPCIDCHANMMRKCYEMLPSLDASFIITGEVLAQRPMSQNRQSLFVVAKESGCAELVLRPLSAKLLEPTKPELEGWVDREKLYDFSGRARKPQMELAKKFGITDFPSPAGGCRLTEPNFSKRLSELMKNEGLVKRDINLLKLGRHFRLRDNVKLIVGRNAADNAKLKSMVNETEYFLTVDNIPGPVAILSGNAESDDINIAAGICARYCDSKENENVDIVVWKDGESSVLNVLPLSQQEIEAVRV